jgi:DNA topoisomerase IB
VPGWIGTFFNPRHSRRDIPDARSAPREIEWISGRLGNTVSVCRKCYVYPEIFAAHLDGRLVIGLKEDADTTLKNERPHLSPEEAIVLAFPQGRVARNQPRDKPVS